MDSSMRALAAGLPHLEKATTTASPVQEKAPDEPAPLARIRLGLAAEPEAATLALREQAIAVGSRGDAKSSSQAPSDSLSRPSRPGLLQMAEHGALAARSAQASGNHSAAPSHWFVALGVLKALPGLYRYGSDLRGDGFRFPPQDGDELALARQGIASLALDPCAPLPTGEILVDRLLDLSVPPGAENDDQAKSLFERLGGIEQHLNSLAIQLADPIDPEAPGRRVLGSLGALEQEVHSLLADTGAGLPAPLRAELTRLGERAVAERGFARSAEAFARAHDTGNLDFGGLMAYMRHGATTQQLRFVLFEQSVTAAFRASYVKGTPVAIPREVADSYEDLWQEVARSNAQATEAAE